MWLISLSASVFTFIILKALNVDARCQYHHHGHDAKDEEEVDVSIVVFHYYNVTHKRGFVNS